MEPPCWISKVEECPMCKKQVEFRAAGINNREEQVEAWYLCECGNQFGFAYTGKCLEAFIKHRDGKQE